MTDEMAATVERLSLSVAARRFVATTALTKVRVTSENIAELRAASRESALPLIEDTLGRYPVTVDEREIGGVPCTVVLGPAASWDRILLFCFGGGMVRGSPFEDLPIAIPLAVNARAAVVMPSYRLAPEFPCPAGAEDVRAVYAALLEHHDRRRVAVVGESAGGNLALSLLQHLPATRRPAAVTLISPWCDLTHGGESLTFNAGRDPTLSRDYLESAAAAYAGGLDPAAHFVSPLFVTTGTRDLLLSDSVRLVQAARSARMRVDLRIWEGLWHAFEYYAIPEAEASLREMAKFLASTFPET
jgi:acetyl esterase/lipase